MRYQSRRIRDEDHSFGQINSSRCPSGSRSNSRRVFGKDTILVDTRVAPMASARSVTSSKFAVCITRRVAAMSLTPNDFGVAKDFGQR